MSTENRVVDIVVDENVPYGLLMQFMDYDEANPLVGTPVNLTGFTLKGSIKGSLEASAPIITNFNASIIDAKQGVASISLPKESVKLLGLAAKNERDKYNARLRFVGYYDVIMTRGPGATATSFRIMEGKVYISDGVTE